MITRELKQIIILPKDVSVETPDSNTIVIKGPKGEIRRTFKTHRLHLSHKGNAITLEGKPNNKTTLDLLMSVDSHIKNIVEGLKFGYKTDMKIFYSHFPMTAKVDGKVVKITNFTGEKFTRIAKIVGNTKVEIKGEDVTVSGINKEDVGQTVANLEQTTKVKGKDIRRFQDGIYLTTRGNIDEKLDEELVEIGNVKEAEVSK